MDNSVFTAHFYFTSRCNYTLLLNIYQFNFVILTILQCIFYMLFPISRENITFHVKYMSIVNELKINMNKKFRDCVGKTSFHLKAIK